MMPSFLVRKAHQIGVSSSTESGIEVGGEPFLRQLHPVSGNPWEADFQRIAFGTNGLLPGSSLGAVAVGQSPASP